MSLRDLGRTGLRVSPLALGAQRQAAIKAAYARVGGDWQGCT